MKVVLIKDVRNMGSNGTVLEVSDGHALNFLIPKKLAIPASAQAVQQATLRQKQSAEKKEIDAQLLAQNLESIAGANVVMKMKANDKGHLYEAASAREISAAVKEQTHIDLPEQIISLEKPIKEIGTYEVPVSSGKNFGSFSITVEAE